MTLPALYFAYGSNLAWSQMGARCRGARRAGIAFKEDYQLAFTRFSQKRGGGVADIVPAVGATVWGALFEMREDDWIALDVHEGAPNAYRREVWEFSREDRSVVSAGVYVVADKRPGAVPTHGYWRLLVDGAIEAGLPAWYVAVLRGLPHLPP